MVGQEKEIRPRVTILGHRSLRQGKKKPPMKVGGAHGVLRCTEFFPSDYVVEGKNGPSFENR